ncbi:hypothetical protein QL285_007708 [Trifolium repens]|nr:hypothetical protein QL285_007708 [Trifolium repens]
MYHSIASTDLTNVASSSIGPFVMYRVKIENIVLTSSSVRSSFFVNNTVPSAHIDGRRYTISVTLLCSPNWCRLLSWRFRSDNVTSSRILTRSGVPLL